MTVPTPRKRFQIHLSTAIVMMFVAGGLIWANLEKRWLCFDHQNNRIEYPYYYWSYSSGTRGWPFVMYADFFKQRLEPIRWVEFRPPMIIYEYLALNLVIALSILFAVWFFCERLIRRRAARK